ncbi:MAG TPA: hypothetical protein H9774_04040 [Candidatus Desulfovibrio gallistercoris]|nr:hypothetical protein [Candidatus Desulfovibrio gallistercoris]
MDIVILFKKLWDCNKKIYQDGHGPDRTRRRWTLFFRLCAGPACPTRRAGLQKKKRPACRTLERQRKFAACKKKTACSRLAFSCGKGGGPF